MNLLDLMKKRYSVRKFKKDPVEEEKIQKIIEAGLCAPTAHNNQPIRIMVLKSEDALSKLKRCTECHYNAPLAFIVSYHKDECWKRSYDGKSSGDVDASIVTTQMMLEAFELDIGSTWLMHFDPKATKEEFIDDEKLEPVAMLVMGYAADDCPVSINHTKKKDPSNIVITK